MNTGCAHYSILFDTCNFIPKNKKSIKAYVEIMEGHSSASFSWNRQIPVKRIDIEQPIQL